MHTVEELISLLIFLRIQTLARDFVVNQCETTPRAKFTFDTRLWRDRNKRITFLKRLVRERFRVNDLLKFKSQTALDDHFRSEPFYILFR